MCSRSVREWTRSSFERRVLEIDEPTEQSAKALDTLIDRASEPSAVRIGHFSLHLLALAPDTKKRRNLLQLVQRCLAKVQEKILASRLRELVFGADIVRTMLIGPAGNDCRIGRAFFHVYGSIHVLMSSRAERYRGYFKK